MEEWQHEKYRLHARLPVFRRKVEEAREIVRCALREHSGVWAASCSGGKDSTVMLRVCVEAGWRGPVFHFVYRETPRENTELVRRLAEEYGLELHVLEVPGAFDVYERVGRFFAFPETEEERRVTAWMLREYKRRADEYVRKQGWVGQFLGMRKLESKRRGKTLRRKGAIYRTQDRETWTACPLANWSATDVWAYIVVRDLPYLSVYDRADDRESERSEVTWLATDALWRRGMLADLRRNNPEVYAQLATRFPDVRKFT